MKAANRGGVFLNITTTYAETGRCMQHAHLYANSDAPMRSERTGGHVCMPHMCMCVCVCTYLCLFVYLYVYVYVHLMCM